MPLDPSIPLRVTVAQTERPTALLSRWLQIHEQAEARKDRAKARKDKDRERSETQALKDVFKKTPRTADGSLDNDALTREAMLIDPETGLKLQREFDAGKSAKLARENQEIALLEKRTQWMGQTADGILKADPARRPTLYARARQEAIANKWGTPDTFPEAYDENFVISARDKAMTISQRLEERRIAAAEKAAEKKEERAKQYQAKSIKWKGKKVSIPFDPDTRKYHMPDGTQAEFAEEWDEPNADTNTHWATTTETLPDGSEVTRTVRARNGTVLKTKPPKPPVTQAQRNQAERWKKAELDKAEALYRNGEVGDEQMQRIKLDVENGYRQQLGEQPIAVLGPEWSKRPDTLNADRQPASPFGPRPSNAEPTQNNNARPQPTPNDPSTPSPRNNPAPVATDSRGNTALRAELAAVLAQYKAERDPSRQAALLRRMAEIRAQIGR